MSWCESAWSRPTWLLLWTQFDMDQLDPNQIDPDEASSHRDVNIIRVLFHEYFLAIAVFIYIYFSDFLTRELEIKETTETAAPPHTWIGISTLTMESLLLGFTTNGMISIFPLLTFHSWAVIPFYTSIRRLRFTVNPLCQNLFKLSGLHRAWKSAHYKVFKPGISKKKKKKKKSKLVATLKKFYGRHHDLVNPYNVAVSRIVSNVFASDAP